MNSLSMALCVATMREGVYEPDVLHTVIIPSTDYDYPGELKSWYEHASKPPVTHIKYNTKENNTGVVGSYQRIYEETTADVLVYAHDDVIMREEGWDERLLREFNDPTVGLVGLGGALEHGHRDLYKVPYKLSHLGRSRYLSNVDDAEVHGERFTGSRDVATIDGFVVAIRRSLLDRMGGWSVINSSKTDRFFCYDYAASGWAHRLGYRVRVTGIRCHHLGGQTSVKVKDNPITGQQAYDESHAWFYNEFRDVMPFRCD